MVIQQPIKVTFDSNVWRKISSPTVFPRDPAIESFNIIRKAIIDKKIIPFLSETTFTLEAIGRNTRQQFISDYRPRIEITENEGNDGDIHIRLTIGPDETAHPGNNHYLNRHLIDAVNIGFQILTIPTVAGITNPDINNDYENYYYTHNDFFAYNNKAGEVIRKIELHQAGMYHIKELGARYNPSDWREGIRQAPDSERNEIAKAVAEWADGNSVAVHIGVGGDYFCTRDSAVNAGEKSVFSQANLDWLRADYGFQSVSPEQLAEIIEQQNAADGAGS